MVCGYRASFCFFLGHDSSQAISLPRLIKRSEELAEDLELEKAKLAKLVDLVRECNHCRLSSITDVGLVWVVVCGYVFVWIILVTHGIIIPCLCILNSALLLSFLYSLQQPVSDADYKALRPQCKSLAVSLSTVSQLVGSFRHTYKEELQPWTNKDAPVFSGVCMWD